MGGVSAIIMSALGANHFRILLALKKEVDNLSKLNQRFREENMALQQEVDKLGRAREQLSSVEAGLKESNRKLKENVEKFRKLADSNIEGLEKLQKSSQQVMKTMQENLIRHEKQILMKVFDHLDLKGKTDGLTKEEFENFWTQMPSSYVQRWEKMGKTFEDIAGDDGVLDYDEFRGLCDRFAEEEAHAGGSQCDA